MLYRAVSSRDHLKLIKSYFGIGTWSYDIKADHFDWSDGLRRLLRVETVMGNTLAVFLEMAHPDDRQALDDKIRTGSTLETAPLRMKAADGAQLWLLFHVEVRSDDQGGLLAFGAAQDVTAIKTTQFLYMQRHRLSMSLVNMLDAIVWYVSPSGVLDFEVGWCDFTGTKMSQNNGEGWLASIHPEDHEPCKAAWRNAIGAKSPVLATLRVRRSDGTYHAFQATIGPVLDDKGAIIQLIGFARRLFDEGRLHPSSHEAARRRWTAEDYCCARAVLGWSVERVATASGVSVSTIKRMESDELEKRTFRSATDDRLRAALEAAGIDLRWESDGVRVIRQRPPAAPRLVEVSGHGATSQLRDGFDVA